MTGAWVVVDASFGADAGTPDATGAVSATFTVSAELDLGSGTYTVTEGSEGRTQVGRVPPSAMTGSRWSTSTTKGHVVKRTWGTVHSSTVVSGGEVGTRVDYAAANRQLVGPLEEVLTAQGWQRKKGRLARMLGF